MTVSVEQSSNHKIASRNRHTIDLCYERREIQISQFG
jgi:hypothetical protein